MVDKQPVLVRFAGALEDAHGLDGYVDLLGKIATTVVPGGSRLAAELRGRSLGHPLHAVMTAVPIGLWIGAAALDVVGGPDTERAARRLLGLGVLAALPTALAGVADFPHLSARARRVGSVHVALNEATLVLYGVSWKLRGGGGGASDRGSGRRRLAVAVADLGLATISVSGFLGAHISRYLHEPEVPGLELGLS